MYIYIYIYIYILLNRISNVTFNPQLVLFDCLPFIYIYNTTPLIYLYCLCGSVATASDTQAVGHGFEPRPDHLLIL